MSNKNFYTILTNIGLSSLTNASITQTKVNFSEIAVGDGNGSYGNPSASDTKLINETWRGQINSIHVDPDNPNWIVVESVIPASVGGFMIREVAVFDDNGNMLAIGKVPETYKPQVLEGSSKDLHLRMIIETSNTDVVELKIDPSVTIVSKDYVDKKIQQVTITGAATTITETDLVANRVLISDSDGKVANSELDSSKLNYLTNVTDDIQSQLSAKTTANIAKNQKDTTGDAISTHLTVGTRASNYKIGDKSFTSGDNNSAINSCDAVVGGMYNVASGSNSAVVGGTYNSANGSTSAVIGGTRNHSLAFQVKMGTYSQAGTARINTATVSGDALIIGNGTISALSNAFRVDYQGNVYGLSAFKASGADIAELYEWEDGNKNKEDRRGLFVTLEGTKIRIANKEDTYIKGVVSASPCLVGDSQSEVWHGMYLKDVFGSYQKDENGSLILNPDYNQEQEYIPREKRSEYDYVSSWGKVVVVDDGTCEVNGFCKVGENGKATKSDTQTAYRVMERKDSTHIYVTVN